MAKKSVKTKVSTPKLFSGTNLIVFIILLVLLLLVVLMFLSRSSDITGNAVTGLAFMGFGDANNLPEENAGCKEGMMKCSSNNVVVCRNGRFVIKSACKMGCMGQGVMTQCMQRVPEQPREEQPPVGENQCSGFGSIQIQEGEENSHLNEPISVYIETDENSQGRAGEWNDFEYLGHSDGNADTIVDFVYGVINELEARGNPQNRRRPNVMQGIDMSNFGENTRTANGIVIENPSDNALRDKQEFRLSRDINGFRANLFLLDGGVDGEREEPISVPVGINLGDRANGGWGQISGRIHETITLNGNGRNIEVPITDRISFNAPIAAYTGLTWPQSGEEDFAERVFVPVVRNTFNYFIHFDELLDNGIQLDDASENNPLFIPFLSRILQIEGVAGAGTQLVLNTQPIYRLHAGESVRYDGHTIQLNECSAFECTFTIDNRREVFREGEARIIMGIRVKVVNLVSEAGVVDDAATIYLGERSVEIVSTGDAFFGEDPDDPAWVWDLANLNTEDPFVGIKWDLDLDNPDELENPLYTHPLYEGESICLPYQYACIEFESLTLSDDEYQNYQLLGGISQDLYRNAQDAVPTYVGERVIEFRALGASDDGFDLDGVNSDTIYFAVNPSTGNLDVYREQQDSAKAVFVKSIHVATGDLAGEMVYGESRVPVFVDWFCEGAGAVRDQDVDARASAFKQRRDLTKTTKVLR